MAAPIFHLIVGPNGAGKTTFYEQWLKPRSDAEFVNPDLLAKDVLGRWSQTRDDATLGQSWRKRGATRCWRRGEA